MPNYTDEQCARWFGEGADPDAARHCLEVLDDQCKRRFGTPVYNSPGYIGLMAWKNNEKWGQGYRPLPVELQQLIRSTTTQGRFECCPVPYECQKAHDGPCPGKDTIPALYCLDLRWAYVAAALTVTSGKQWRHEERPGGGWPLLEYTGLKTEGRLPPNQSLGYLDWTPARYRVRFVAPAGWSHVGILPYRAQSGWQWPPDGSGAGSTWADHTEVRLAIECGWQVEILERLVCVDDVKHYDRPLLLWAQNLLRLREDLARESTQPGQAKLYHAAIRAMILQAIGMMAARPKTATRTVSSRDELPGHDLAEETYYEDEEGIHFEDYERSGLSRHLHPEIASAVWGQTRAWLLRKRQAVTWDSRRLEGQAKIDTGALALPREQIVGFGLDCLWLTSDPHWPDDGREGRWRVKWHREGPLPAPKNRTELEAHGD